MHEYLREQKDGLEKCENSLNPPYPAFDAFIRDLLENGVTAKEIAGHIMNNRTGSTVQEEIISSWAAGSLPGANLRAVITKALGYDFQEYRFAQVAITMEFPLDTFPSEIRAIRNVDSLRMYLLEAIEKIGVNALTNFFEFPSINTISAFANGEGVAEETYKKILKKIAELPEHLLGTILSLFTPKLIVSHAARICRQARGMTRKTYAAHLGVDYGYYSYVEELAGQIEQGKNVGKHSQHPERLIQLCEALMKERGARIPAIAREEKGDEMPAPSVREDDGEIISQMADLARSLDAIRPKLDQMLQRAGHPRVADERYVSPFSSERWQPHDAAVDETRVATVHALIKVLCEELGHLASVRNEARRAQIREQLTDPLLIELVGAIDLFGRAFPGAAIQLMDSWRRDIGV